MKKLVFISIYSVFLSILCSAQYVEFYDHIPSRTVQHVLSEGSDRTGSCASPNGPILAPTLTAYPTYNYMYNNGYCYDISPPKKNDTYCYTFTSPGTDITLDAAFSFTYITGFTLWFDNFTLYTCAPTCSVVGTGLSFTGLTAGTCYTWCFDTHMTGGGPGSGFTEICPYLIYVAPLPVELSDFYSYWDNGITALYWTTESEINCAYFDVERAFDAEHFEGVGQVSGNGNSTVTQQYSFQLQNCSEPAYYRLKQMDLDGGYAYSDVIFIDKNLQNAEPFYINFMGQRIDPATAPAGMYIRCFPIAGKRNSTLVYKQ